MKKYISTRNDSIQTNTFEAILKGLADDGGLFVPTSINKLDNLYDLKDLSYIDLAFKVISNIFDDVDPKVLYECIEGAYLNNFTSKDVTPLVQKGNYYFLELYHGPTSAFKDVALTFLPRILKKASDSISDKPVVILTATSGDTGKAALEGFKDVEGVNIKVLYPHNMVSKIQERQMSTTGGNNTEVLAVNGNFDDCQAMVKNILENYHFDNINLSSANSINIARLVPQIVYYFKAYLDLYKNNQINKDEKIDFIVPTGNFGDILAGYIAKLMGLPVNKLVCASNINNVLTDFINTGTYNSNRELYNTISPSIDILVSSNLERLLYLKIKDTNKVKELMTSLKNNKEYKVDENILKLIQDDFVGICATEIEAREVIKEYYDNYNYLIDTHTAMALACAKKYESSYKQVILSTASPYKFSKDVYYSLTGVTLEDNLDCMDKLHELTKVEVPTNLLKLKDLPIRFKEVINKDDYELLTSKLKEY